MSTPKRKADGTFAKGVSGNPNGRPPKKPVKHRLPAHNRETAFEVAEMPVKITLDGEVTETSAYRAALISLTRKALSGHTPSMRLLLSHIEKAATINGEQNEFTRRLIEQQLDLEVNLEELRELIPEDPGHGVYVQLPDGRAMPNSLYGKLERLKNLDEREAKLKEDERRLAELEERLNKQINAA
jgi:hypothetical protein